MEYFICNRAISNVLGLPVISISPDSGDRFATLLRNSTLYPREKACENSTSSVFTDHKSSSSFRANHIVPVIVIHNRSVQVNVQKIPKFINQRLHFRKS